MNARVINDMNSNAMDVRHVNIAEISVPDGPWRPRSDLGALKQSIEDRGLIHPVTITLEGKLIAGRHRLEAHRQLGRTTIACRAVDVSKLEAELIQIDENLARSELSALEHAEHVARRKQIYEEIHPETKQGGAPGKPGGGKTKNPGSRSIVAETVSLTGQSRSTIHEDAKIGALLQEVRDALRASPMADKKGQLLELSRQPEQMQLMIARLITSGAAKSVRDAHGILVPATCEERTVAKALDESSMSEVTAHSRTKTAVSRVAQPTAPMTSAPAGATTTPGNETAAAPGSEEEEEVVAALAKVEDADRGLLVAVMNMVGPVLDAGHVKAALAADPAGYAATLPPFVRTLAGQLRRALTPPPVPPESIRELVEHVRRLKAVAARRPENG